MSKSFDNLKALIPVIKNFTATVSHEAFYKDEVLRFHSIAGTIEDNFKNIPTCIDERILSHILFRSLIENFFKLMYVYDDSSLISARFDELLNSFKKDYAKLFNEPALPYKSQLEPPLSTNWSSLPSALDMKSMLAQVRNIHGQRLDYIYFIYRVSSFDTHGNSLNSLFEVSFQKKCNFPFIQLDSILEIISSEYLSIWKKINP